MQFECVLLLLFGCAINSICAVHLLFKFYEVHGAKPRASSVIGVRLLEVRVDCTRRASLYLSKHDSLCLLIFNAGDLFVTAELVEKCLVVSIGVATRQKGKSIIGIVRADLSQLPSNDVSLRGRLGVTT